jgi:hypothetical protein
MPQDEVRAICFFGACTLVPMTPYYVAVFHSPIWLIHEGGNSAQYDKFHKVLLYQREKLLVLLERCKKDPGSPKLFALRKLLGALEGQVSSRLSSITQGLRTMLAVEANPF